MLQAGLGLINETKILLELWTPEMSTSQLYQTALKSGQFSKITASRLKNIVMKCFAPRYLRKNGVTALHLKQLLPKLNYYETQQLLFLFTCRANLVMRDFVQQVYWEKYVGGYRQISSEDARTFVVNAVEGGKTTKKWSENTTKRVSAYLTGCCADYGLLENGSKSIRRILSFYPYPKVVAYLAYDLHLAGLGDTALLNHEDWVLFGFNQQDVLTEMKKLSLKGFFIIQAAGEIVKISWKYQSMEELCNVLTQK